MHAHETEGATTLVWIDSEEAIIVRWADRAAVERVRSEVPGRHRSDGHSTLADAMRIDGGAMDAHERARRDELRHFVDAVACRVPDTDDVMVVGPGVLRGRLERVIRADDRHHGRRRLVHSGAAERLTEQELVARVRAIAGEAPPRFGVPT
ncbi:MAG TPA: hypothetical protein VES19_04395 [Candidatus Limnocylindrales bacterium]|nr:hypothetical protein [Candidatus Limnocylindrales bacterium]